MSFHQIKCELCGRVFHIDKYGDGSCPDCDTKYSYDEGYFANAKEVRNAALDEAVKVAQIEMNDAGSQWHLSAEHIAEAIKELKR